METCNLYKRASWVNVWHRNATKTRELNNNCNMSGRLLARSRALYVAMYDGSLDRTQFVYSGLSLSAVANRETCYPGIHRNNYPILAVQR